MPTFENKPETPEARLLRTTLTNVKNYVESAANAELGRKNVLALVNNCLAILGGPAPAPSESQTQAAESCYHHDIVFHAKPETVDSVIAKWRTTAANYQHSMGREVWGFAADELAPIAARLREREEKLRRALEASVIALDDWLNIHASDYCDKKRVNEAYQRVYEHGTTEYIAQIQKGNREALEAILGGKE